MGDLKSAATDNGGKDFLKVMKKHKDAGNMDDATMKNMMQHMATQGSGSQQTPGAPPPGGTTGRRRRLSFMSPEAFEKANKYTKYSGYVVGILCVLAPILITLILWTFCCTLKNLSNHEETLCEARCGCIFGCLVSPVLIIGTIATSSIFIAVVMILCVIFMDPIGLAMPIAKLKDFSISNIRAIAMNKPDDPDFPGIDFFNKAYDATWNGTLCSDGDPNGEYKDLATIDGVKTAPPKTFARYVSDKKKTSMGGYDMCTQWSIAYRTGVATQALILALTCLSLLMGLYIAYKSCCRNFRTQARYRADEIDRRRHLIGYPIVL